MALEAQGLGPVERAAVEVCGPGPAAVRRWFAEDRPAPELVVLAGVAGGLAAGIPIGAVRHVGEVVAEDGTRWSPPIRRSGPTWRVVGVDHLVATPSAKRRLGSQTGAAIVDMESHAFAAEASARGWPWAIVRGVSDTVDESLPPAIESLLDERGRPRALRAALFVATHPHLLPLLRRLGARTTSTMAAVRPLVAALVAESLDGQQLAGGGR